MNTITNFPRNDIDFGLDESEAVFPVQTNRLQALGREGGTLPIDSHKSVVRFEKDGTRPRVIGVVGSGYELARNRPLFASMEESIRRSMEPSLMRGFKVSTKTSFDGAWCRREYIFPSFADELKTSTNFSTQVGFRIIGWNSYDGSSSAGLATGLIDFYCENGMISGSLVDLTKRRHTSGLTIDFFDQQIERGIKRVQEEVRMLRKLATTDLDMERAEEILRKSFSEQRANKMMGRLQTEIETRGPNVFALHSALTYYSSHNSEEFGVRQTGGDNVAKTLQNREAEVARIMPKVYALAA